MSGLYTPWKWKVAIVASFWASAHYQSIGLFFAAMLVVIVSPLREKGKGV